MSANLQKRKCGKQMKKIALKIECDCGTVFETYPPEASYGDEIELNCPYCQGDVGKWFLIKDKEKL